MEIKPNAAEKTMRIKARLRRNHWKREYMTTRDFIRLPKGKYELSDENRYYTYILEKGEYQDGSRYYLIHEKRDSFRIRCIFLHEEKEPVIDKWDNETGYFYTSLSAHTSFSGFSFHCKFYEIYQKLYFVKKIQ